MNISDVIEAFEKKAYPVRDGLKFSDLGPCQARDSDGWLQAYRLLTSMTEGYCLRPMSPPRGESMPQTVEHCHAVMARDMDLILEQKAEISKLKASNNNLGQKLKQLAGCPNINEIKATGIREAVQQYQWNASPGCIEQEMICDSSELLVYANTLEGKSDG